MEKPHRPGLRSKYEKSFTLSPDSAGSYLIYQIGEQCCDPGYTCGEHYQWCYEISYVVEGNGINVINGEQTEIREGDVFVSPVGAKHEVRSVGCLRYMFLGFGMCGGSVSDDIRALDSFYAAPPVCVVRGNIDILQIFSRCLNEYYNGFPCHGIMIESYITELIVSVMRLYLSHAGKSYRNELDSGGTVISVYAVILYIDSCIRTVNSIRQISEVFNYSPSYISHSFRQQTGMTLRQYICKKKIEESVRMVDEEGFSITDVSQKIGFATPQAYTRAFKRVMGVPPSVFFDGRRSPELRASPVPGPGGAAGT